jgi:hypothetical protein
MVWTAPDGGTLDLHDQERYIVDPGGTRGLRSVTYSMTTARFGGLDGETVQAVRADANTPTVGLKLFADDDADLRARMRGLVRAMRPKAGPGRLTVTTPGGESRHLDCYCTGGLEGDESLSVTRPGRWWRVALKMYAPDPWWYGDEQVIDFGLAAPSVFFPIFPLVLSPSAIQGNFTIDLAHTDAETYPTWTVTGPGSALHLTNVTTGRSIELAFDLGDGQTATIDTRPGRQSVRAEDGTNLMSGLSSDPALWPLTDATNEISALLTGAGPASRIVGTYRPRYSGI